MKLLDNLLHYGNKAAFVYNGTSYNYNWLHNEVKQYIAVIDNVVNRGDVVQLCSDYNPKAIAVFIALIYKRAIIAPLTNIANSTLGKYNDIMKPQVRITISESQEIHCEQFQQKNNHIFVKQLYAVGHAGLIIMSSGTTGNVKAITHDLCNIIDKQNVTKSHKTILAFLLFDHIGGINAILNAIVSGNTLVLPSLKDANSIGELIQNHGVNVLITSPSFLNLMVISDVWGRFNLLSLKHINYGSEVMPQYLLTKLSEFAPNIRLSQSYGMSELGVLKTKSESNSSLAIKIGNDNARFRVADGKLEIKSSTSMLGYLNAPSPFTADGWLKTGDMVEVLADGWLKILGRESDIINIGGMKVFPIEIENVLLQMPGVKDVVVCAEPNAILGNIVKAQVLMDSNLALHEKIRLLRTYCFENLDSYKVPQKFEFIDTVSHCRRHKKLRNNHKYIRRAA